MSAAVTAEATERWLRRAIAVAAGLAVLGWIAVRPPESAGDKSPLAIDLPRAEDQASAGVEIDEAIRRPLFWPGRRPVDTAADEAAGAGSEGQQAAPPEEAGFEFVATMLESEQRFAIIRSLTSGIHRVQEGDSVDGWQVSGISPRGISLRSEEGTLELEPPAKPTVTLSEAQKSPAAQPVAAAPAEPQAQGNRREGRGRENRDRRNRDRGGRPQQPDAITPEQMSEAMKSLGERLQGFGQIKGETP